MNRPTRERVLELLSYDPGRGEFRWLVDRVCGHGRIVARAGDVAGAYSVRNGWIISIDGKQYKAHMLAWLIMIGAWPEQIIDHRDGNKKNNRWLNLRPATPKINAQNQRRASAANRTSGMLGVCSSRSGLNPWRAQINVGGKQVYLGMFKTPEAAHAAYVAAKRKLHEGCTL